MSWISVLPMVVTALGVLGVVVLGSGAADEARRLGVAVRQLGQLRPAVVEVRSGAAAVREAMEGMRRT